MKLRYYLRGLGIGIIVTAIIMSFTRQPEKLSDAQIKMRAFELGMVEESVLADLQDKKEESHIPAFEDIVNVETEDQENVEDGNSETESQGVTEESNSEMEEQKNVLENNASIDVQEVIEEKEQGLVEGNTSEAEEHNIIEETDVESDANTEGAVTASSDEAVEKYFIILVESGNGSEVISRRLYEAGLVNSAVEYNKFLVRNGYDRKLKVGNHEIPVGATEEEMSKILCGMR